MLLIFRTTCQIHAKAMKAAHITITPELAQYAFDGGARPGLQRRMRETIAENLGADYRDVGLHQREVHL